MHNEATTDTTRTRLIIETDAHRSEVAATRGSALVRIGAVLRDFVGAHPLALARPDLVTSAEARASIERMIEGYTSGAEYYIDKLASGIAGRLSEQNPRECIIALNDMSTQQYEELVGGEVETCMHSDAPGARGVARYLDTRYRDVLAMECEVIRRLRARMGMTSITVAIPFCRTLGEADAIVEMLAGHGLQRGVAGLELQLCCAVPSNALLADLFAERFDGFIVETDELCRHVFATDVRGYNEAQRFDEAHAIVHRMVSSIVESVRGRGASIAVSGSGVGQSRELVDYLVESGIDAIVVGADCYDDVRVWVAQSEARVAERMPLEPINVHDCPQGMVGVLFIDEMMPPNGAFAGSAHSIANVAGRARRVRAFERLSE